MSAPTPPSGTAGGDHRQTDHQQPGYPQQSYPQQPDHPPNAAPQSYPRHGYDPEQPQQGYPAGFPQEHPQGYVPEHPQGHPQQGGAHRAEAAAAGVDWTAPGVSSPAAEPGVEGVSVGELIGNVTRDLSTLMRQELQLARAELKQEATKTGKAAGALTGAGLAGWFVLLFLSIALWAALSNLMDSGWAGLVVAAVWAVIAAVLYAVGRSRLREVRPKPDRTVDTLSSVPDALKGQRGGTP